jgi:hypothetical protein
MGDLVKFKRVIGHLAEQLKLGDLEPDEEGACYLAFDEDLMMQCSALEDTNQIEMVSYIGMFPTDNVGVFREILSCNHFWRDTAGANLGISEADNVVKLVQLIDMDLVDEDSFYKKVENFVNAMDHWKTKFPELAKLAESGGGAEASPQVAQATGSNDPGFMMGV